MVLPFKWVVCLLDVGTVLNQKKIKKIIDTLNTIAIMAVTGPGQDDDNHHPDLISFLCKL